MTLISEIMIEVNNGDQDFFFDPKTKFFDKDGDDSCIPLVVLSLDNDSHIYNKQWRKGIFIMCDSKARHTDKFSHVESFDDLKAIDL